MDLRLGDGGNACPSLDVSILMLVVKVVLVEKFGLERNFAK